MARLSFLWHLHQPGYRTADGVSHAPWAALHAGGAYRTLAAAIRDTEGPGQVVNIVPTLLEQLVAYRDGAVTDPVLDTLVTPTAELSDGQRETLVEWAFHVTPRQLERYPRLAELARRRRLASAGSRLAAAFGPGDLRDLQVLFVLAQAGEQAWTDPRLIEAAARGSGFTPLDHERVADWLTAQPGELIELWRSLAAIAGVEISTSPYAHPIMPLLVDTRVVADSWSPHPPPEVPVFAHPEDAAWQLAEGLLLMRSNELEVVGCWPPEGSVSAEALAVYADAEIAWLVTDEGILEKSLGRPLRNNGRATDDLYRAWTLDGPSPTLYFRDRELSDAIGFRYGRWNDEASAAWALVDELGALARSLPDDATIVLALDGENPWLHYPDGGGRFLRELMGALAGAGDELVPATLTELAGGAEPAVLDRLHPGSWINGIFATWIGHPEKTAAWRLLTEVRDAIDAAGADRPPSLLLAEGSDWFWWLGDDNPTELAPLYDEIFRRHLGDACEQAGVAPPANLETPIKLVGRRVAVPVAAGWRPPVLDGRVSSYFEWCLATVVDNDDDRWLRRVSLWAAHGRLYVLLEGGPAAQPEPGGVVEVRLEPADGAAVAARFGADATCDHGVEAAVDRVVEIALPWNGAAPARLHLTTGEPNGLGGAVLQLEPVAVDESNPADSEE